MYPNDNSPIIAQVIALYSVSQAREISAEVMDAVLDVSKDKTMLKPMMENWNSAATSGLINLNKKLAVTEIFRAICQSSMDTHKDKNDLGPMADLLRKGLSDYRVGNTAGKVGILLSHYNLTS